MSEGSPVRASDAEREQLAREIREHFSAGRLTEEELDERVQAAYAARNVAELEALRLDLPVLPPSASQRRADLAHRREKLQRQLLQQVGGGLVAFVICTAIWLAAGAKGTFWPVWVALAPAIILLRGGWLLYGPAPELDRMEHELESRERQRAARRRARRDERRLGR